MIAIELLKTMNERVATVRHATPADTARPCSFCYSRQGRTVVLHSASLRSTLVYSSDAVKTVFKRDGTISHRPWRLNREIHFALTYWLAQSPEAVNAIIENLARDKSLEEAESAACISSRPEWSFRRVQYQNGGGDILAFRQFFGLAVERQVANNWRWIHARTAD